MSLDATLSWSASATGTPTSYSVIWTYNALAQPPVSVPVTAASNASGYTLDFVTSNPSITVAAGDVIGGSVQAIDSANNLSSAVVVSSPPTVTEPGVVPPPTPPGPPLAVTLVLA